MRYEVLKLKKERGKWVEAKNELKRFEQAGVWVMTGVDSENHETLCLEVGETCNIKKEVNRDYEAIVKSLHEENSKKKKFRKTFSWSETICGNIKESRFKAKYRQISQSCEEITVLVVLCDENIENRYNKEIQQAWDNKAIYWYPAPTNLKRCKVSQWKVVGKLKMQANE